MGGPDAVFGALADSRRRIALARLLEHRRMALADLAELVAEREHGAPVSELDDQRVADLYLSLYHTHVPVLEDAGVARYEQEQDLVAITERAEDRLASARETVTDLQETP